MLLISLVNATRRPFPTQVGRFRVQCRVPRECGAQGGDQCLGGHDLRPRCLQTGLAPPSSAVKRLAVSASQRWRGNGRGMAAPLTSGDQPAYPTAAAKR
jgi:hypothetical protein